MIARALSSLALVLLSACATSRGFDRGSLAREVRRDAPPVTDEEVARVLALKPQLPAQMRVAVFFRPARPERFSRAEHFVWRGEDRDAVLAPLRALEREGMVAEVIPMSDAVAAGDGLKDVRLAAARTGADAVILVTGAASVDRYNNAAALLYLTLVGGWLVPGTHADALFLASGTVWDVRNEFLYASAEAEATRSETGPAFILENGPLVDSARRDALTALGAELVARVRTLREAPAAGPPRP